MLCRVYREGEPTPTQITPWLPKGAVAPERVVTSRGTEPSPAHKSNEIEARIKAAFDHGRQEAEAAANQRAAQKVEPIAASLNRLIQDLAGVRKQFRSEAEQDTVKLAIAIARRVLHRELTLDPESIEGLIRIALEKLESRELCRVRVHPDQQPAIRASLDRFSNSQKVELIPDPSLQCGDVLFETAHGTIDASIEAQLREIERGFADRLGR